MTANDSDTEDWDPTVEGEAPPDEVDETGADAPESEAVVTVGAERSLAEYVQWAVLAILLLVTVIATLRFYFAASTAVDRFVTSQYRPLVQAAFNLVIVLAAGAGLSVLVRRLS